MSEKHPSTCFPAAKHQKHNKLNFTHMRITSDFSVANDRNGTFEQAKILLIY